MVLAIFLAAALLVLGWGSQIHGQAAVERSAQKQVLQNDVYLPLLYTPPGTPPYTPPTTRTVNVPYFLDAQNPQAPTIVYTETAIFWFGSISQQNNYSDVRVGYNNIYLQVRLAIFDRFLWADDQPTPTSLTGCDSASLYLRLDGGTGAPSTQTFRFDAALSQAGVDRTPYQQAYRGNGSGWVASSTAFTSLSGFSWEDTIHGGINNGEPNRGWLVTYRVPFSSLGLSAPPPQGTLWPVGVVVYDQEAACGDNPPPVTTFAWPEALQGSDSATWGAFRFGLPAPYPQPPPGSPSVMIRERLNNAVVPDAAVGGTIPTLCPGNPDFIWNTWGNRNYGEAMEFNVQNQAALADWPCFAKYYVTFPLDQVPPGKTVLYARLTLHHWGGSDPVNTQESLLQVFSVDEDWNESTINWNNAPLALENIARTWEEPYTLNPPVWPGRPVHWDVTAAVLRAYVRDEPVSLAVYSADGAQHSGKYFTASETGYDDPGSIDWNAEGRPTLIVTWAEP